MLPRILGWAVVLGTAAVALVLVWPQAFGLQNQWVAAHVVALRGTAAACGILALIVFLLLAFVRPIRVFSFAMAAVFALFAAGNVAVLTAQIVRGPPISPHYFRNVGQTDLRIIAIEVKS